MLFNQPMKSLIPEIEISDAKEDRKTAKRVGQYKISFKAIYKADNTYLPLEAIRKVTHDRTSVHVSGCCAGGVWVERLIFDTASGRFPFIFENQNEISKVKELCAVEMD